MGTDSASDSGIWVEDEPEPVIAEMEVGDGWVPFGWRDDTHEPGSLTDHADGSTLAFGYVAGRPGVWRAAHVGRPGEKLSDLAGPYQVTVANFDGRPVSIRFRVGTI